MPEDKNSGAYQPYLSIVTTARNDNHGGNMLHRMQIFINGFLSQSAKHQLNTELIIVEWNPPPDKPRLSKELSWPEQHDFCTIRIIEVPAEIHQRYKHADRLPLYQMIAKNVGIRRARGEFILATNIDIIFSDELFAFFASGKMTKGKMYRVNRHDVPSDIPLDASIDEQMSYCRQNVIRINHKYGTINPKTGEYNMIYPNDVDTNPPIYLNTVCVPLHTNACGDFQLMSRENWDIIYGYPELDMFSFHLDSVLSYMAHFGGVAEEILPEPMCIYHIEHTAGWTPEVQKDGTFYSGLKSANIRRLTDYEFQRIVVKMTRENRHIIFNGNGWGLASEKSDEHIIVCAARDNVLQSQHQSQHPGIDKGQRSVAPVISETSNVLVQEQLLVSIITTCLNGMPYMQNCIKSVLSQDYPNIEYVVQDRGSTDGTVELLKNYGNRINWISTPDSHQGEAMDRALQRCKGDIVSICNSDNELLPHAVSWAVHNFGKLTDVGVIYGDYYEIDEQGNIMQGAIPGPVSYDYERILGVEDVIPMHSAFFRRSVLEQAGLFNNPWLPKMCEDFAILVRLGLVAKILHVPYTVSKCVLHSGSEAGLPNTLHDIYNTKKEVLEYFFLEPDVPFELKSLRYRAMGGLALSVAEMFLLHFGDLITALRYFKLARDEQPDVHHLNFLDKKIWTSTLQQYIQQGEYLYAIRKYEEALAFYDSISGHDSWVPGIHFSRALCLLQLDRVKDASLALQKELSLHPDHEEARELLEQISCIT